MRFGHRLFEVTGGTGVSGFVLTSVGQELGRICNVEGNERCLEIMLQRPNELSLVEITASE